MADLGVLALDLSTHLILVYKHVEIDPLLFTTARYLCLAMTELMLHLQIMLLGIYAQ